MPRPKKKLPEKFDPFAPVKKPRTICGKCKHARKVGNDPVLYCSVAVDRYDLINGRPWVWPCQKANTGDCPKYEEKPQAPPPPWFWQRVKEWFA